MYASDLYISLIVGVTLSLLYTEKTGILPSGLIVPGYIALIFDQLIFVLLIFLVSFMTYLLVMHVLTKITILYGRRKFAAMLSVGIALKLLLDFLYPMLPFEVFELVGLGIIVPGLIANTIHKQGVILTVSSTFLLSGLTFLVIYGYNLIWT